MGQLLQRAFNLMNEVFHELELPGVSQGVFMGRPSLIHRGKAIINSKDGESIVVHCPLEIKELLYTESSDIRNFRVDVDVGSDSRASL